MQLAHGKCGPRGAEGGSLRGLGQQVPANSAEDKQQTDSGKTKIYKY